MRIIVLRPIYSPYGRVYRNGLTNIGALQLTLRFAVATNAESTDTPGEWTVTVISEDVTYVYICVYSEDGDIIADDTVSIVVTTVGSGEENENTNP